MPHLVFFVEEGSMEAMLKEFLPRIIPGADFVTIAHQGKSDLERMLVRKIRGYQVPGARFIVVRDQDSSDCMRIKQNLTALCRKAGKPDALVRIACREMESWYLADLAAVEAALGVTGLVGKQNSRKFRNPDYLHHPDNELRDLLDGAYRKKPHSEAIGRRLDPENTRSPSFRNFVTGVRRMAQ